MNETVDANAKRTIDFLLIDKRRANGIQRGNKKETYLGTDNKAPTIKIQT